MLGISHQSARCHDPVLVQTVSTKRSTLEAGRFIKGTAGGSHVVTVPHFIKPRDAHGEVRIDRYWLVASSAACYALFMSG